MSDGGAIRVLNVEDYTPTRYARSKILREAGFEVVEASTGAEALALVQSFRPHLALLDMNLPDLGGSEVCGRIKGDPRTAMVQVLHVSASYRESDDYARALDRGADGYLAEPIEPRVLVASVRALVRARRAEEALQAASRHWQMTFEAITDGVCLLDREGNVVRYNPVFGRLAGLDGSLAGRSGIEVFEAVMGRPEALPEMFAASGRTVTEIEVVGGWLQIARDPVIGAGGELDGAVCIVTDISEHKRMEKMSADLLAAEQAARVSAEAANRAKDDFLAILSHELRTPLTAILGWVGMLATRRLDAQTTERAMEVVSRNARLQVQLVDELLDVSRMISGKMSLTTAPADLVRVLRASIDSLRGAAADKQIEVGLRVDGEARLIQGDVSRLQQIFTNVVGNAVKFTPEGGRVTVVVEFAQGRVQVTVTDTGQGIDPAFLPHLFDPFRQAEAAGRRARQGLGLGLAIARHLVELHGGTIAAASDGAGRGATITVTLPADLPAPEPASPAIAVTAFARETDHAKALGAGDDRHVAKPV